MLIPLRHESMQGRRWPIITIGLIVLNTLFFLLTHGKIEEQSQQEGVVKVHVLMLAALHPELKMPDDVQHFVEKTGAVSPSFGCICKIPIEKSRIPGTQEFACAMIPPISSRKWIR